MAINLGTKNILSLKKILLILPSVILVILFIVLIYFPKNSEIKSLKEGIAKLDNEIASSEVNARKLDQLRVENTRLKERLAELQEQLPEEKEVSSLLKQITDLGLKSELEILLWRPEARKPNPDGLYVEIPVMVSVIGGYHNLGVFFSHISQIKRIVNISDIKVVSHTTKEGVQLIKADFIASTFSAMTE